MDIVEEMITGVLRKVGLDPYDRLNREEARTTLAIVVRRLVRRGVIKL